MVDNLCRVAVLVVVGLLAVAASASAECAWVFWTKVETPAGSGSTDWGIVQATPARADCLVALERTKRTAIRNLSRVVGDKVAMDIAGIKTRAIFDRYNISSDREKRAALEAIRLPTSREAR